MSLSRPPPPMFLLIKQQYNELCAISQTSESHHREHLNRLYQVSLSINTCSKDAGCVAVSFTKDKCEYIKNTLDMLQPELEVISLRSLKEISTGLERFGLTLHDLDKFESDLTKNNKTELVKTLLDKATKNIKADKTKTKKDKSKATKCILTGISIMGITPIIVKNCMLNFKLRQIGSSIQ